MFLLKHPSTPTDSSHLLLSPDGEINPNVRNFNLIINNLAIGLSSHISVQLIVRRQLDFISKTFSGNLVIVF